MGSPIAVGAGPVRSPPPTSTATARWTSPSPSERRSLDVLRRGGAGVRPRHADRRVTGHPSGVAVARLQRRRRPRRRRLARSAPNQLARPAQPVAAAAQPPPPTPTPDPHADARRPDGRTRSTCCRSGQGEVKLKGSSKYVDLTQGVQVATAPSVDARDGRVDDRRPAASKRQGGLLRRPVQDQPVQGADHADADRGARLPKAKARRAPRPRSRRRASCGATARASSAPRAATARPPSAAPSGSSPTPAPRPRRRSRRAPSASRDVVKQKNVDRAQGQALHGRARSARAACAPAARCATSGTARRPPWSAASRSRRPRRGAARPRRACRRRCRGARARRP